MPQCRLCVGITLHLSKQCDAWLPPIDLVKICQPPCLFSGCADSLAACLFVYPLSRSKQVPSLSLSLPPRPPSHPILRVSVAPRNPLVLTFSDDIYAVRLCQNICFVNPLMDCVFQEVTSHMSLLQPLP